AGGSRRPGWAAGGLGAGIIAVKSGNAEEVAQGVLTGLSAWAIITSVMLGFGMNPAFSDTELRRYPLKAHERRFARHFTGAVDPFWFLFLALELGLAFGLYLYGAANLLLGLIAVLLVYVCSYLAAQVVGLLLDQIMHRRGGSIVLPLIIMLVCVLPGAVMPKLEKNRAAAKAILRVIGYTPTFGAGSLMTRTDTAALYGFALVGWWLVGLTLALVALERRPPKPRAAQTARMRWDTIFTRIGEKFGPALGPLVAHWLLFYSRCKRLRISYLMSLPLIPFLLLMWTRQGGKHPDPFPAAVGVFAVCGLFPAAAGVVNVYGYVGGGFRRYFLFPGNPGASLRAASYALLTMCIPGIVMATIAWLAYPPAIHTAKAMTMLVASGLAGMFFFHGAGLWTSLCSPRRGDPNATMGNDLSAGGNVLLIGGMITIMLGPRFAAAQWKGLITPDGWWLAVALAVAAGMFYFASLRRAEAAFSSRREKLLALLEGRA
ncbi:MAG: hypothetical protein LAQ30_31360, partial [Acidobacteriia bacterium]|nr:hypothetical protein [Terriglobia bacterium]